MTSFLSFARKGAKAQSIHASAFLAALTFLVVIIPPSTHAENHPAYTIQAIPTPEGVPFEASAVETLPDGRIAIALRKGEVWLLDNPDPAQANFTKIAEALHEPLDLLHKDDGLYVVQRGELTHLRDTNGDDLIDEYRSVTSAWGITGNYHEYAYGAVPDKDGSLWVTLNIGMGKADYPERDAWRGWGVKIFPDGHMEPQCAGMRSPCGLGANLAGDVFFTDQQGNWIPAGSLHHLRKGAFYGHVESLKHCALPGAPFAKPASIPSGIPLPQAKAVFPMLSLPAVWFPYKKVGMSTTDILCVQNDQQIGPFAGQLLVGDFTTAAISRVFLEQVNGEYQGACFNFLEGFQSAVLRMAWAKDGSLIVGESNRGWNSVGKKSFGLDRVTWNGKTPFEIQEMRLNTDGFTLRFTQPVDTASAANPSSYTLSSYTLMYHGSYGSPEIDTRPHAIQSATLSDDAMEVRLVTDPIRQYHIHELHAEGVKNTEDQPLLHADAYYTTNELRAQ
ncbi:MAG: hypothetical protein JNK74_18805 [Candidatus Hydrogenedentes bacterium]|nr:hypothetical protein [Candidatus Hydrogenedentota bacterium]